MRANLIKIYLTRINFGTVLVPKILKTIKNYANMNNHNKRNTENTPFIITIK